MHWLLLQNMMQLRNAPIGWCMKLLLLAICVQVFTFAAFHSLRFPGVFTRVGAARSATDSPGAYLLSRPTAAGQVSESFSVIIVAPVYTKNVSGTRFLVHIHLPCFQVHNASA